MSHHVLGDVDWHMGLPVVDSNGHSYHFWEDHRSARPGLYQTAVSAASHRQYLLSERWMDIWSLFLRARHDYFFLLPALRRRTMKRSVRLFLRVLTPRAGLPHGVLGWPPIG